MEKETVAVCQDFSVFCDYIMEKKVKLSKKTGNMGKRIFLEILDGTVDKPEVIKAVNDAPEQYPYYEEETCGWEVEISEQVQVSDFLESIEDELIVEEYAALTGMKDRVVKEDISVIHRDMERILLHKPDRMLIFITAEMRNMLSELLQNEWVEECEMCTLAKLYSFGFCQWMEDGDEILVPAPIKEIYLPKLRVSGKKDKIVKTAEAFLKRCGVMEMQLLHSAVVKFLKCKISYEEFNYLIYSRLHYFGMYYWNRYRETEYMSCYDEEMTQKILVERQKPENAASDYPDFGKIFAEKGKEIPEALKKWKEYVDFNLIVDLQGAG